MKSNNVNMTRVKSGFEQNYSLNFPQPQLIHPSEQIIISNTEETELTGSNFGYMILITNPYGSIVAREFVPQTGANESYYSDTIRSDIRRVLESGKSRVFIRPHDSSMGVSYSRLVL